MLEHRDTHPAHTEHTEPSSLPEQLKPSKPAGKVSLSSKGSAASPSGLPVLRVGEEHRTLLQERWRHWHSYDRPRATACATP